MIQSCSVVRPGSMTQSDSTIQALVIGASAGGMQVLTTILPQLPRDLPIAVFIVQHQKADGKHYLCSILKERCALPVHEAEDKMPIKAGHVYLAPPSYHLLIESVSEIALSLDEPVHCCRPSIDMLFESAADVFNRHLMAIVLTGMGRDGAEGLQEIDQAGGLCAVQDPNLAEYPAMPKSALANVPHAQCIDAKHFRAWLNTALHY